MKRKYLPLYFDWVESGQRLPDFGLCWCFGYWRHESEGWQAREGYEDFALFIPTEYSKDYWADDGHDDHRYFNPLRQNIVLFLAAMNNEL